MRIAELGEFGLIGRLTDAFERSYRPRGRRDPPGLIVGNGDDAAAWDPTPGAAVLTCDAAAAGTHFDLAYMDPEDVGWRAMVSCQSDIAAMGFVPTYSTVTVGVTGREEVATLEGVYAGMAQACSLYGGRIVGGDVIRAETLFVSVAMVGAAPDADGGPQVRPMTRDAARPGDVVAVTGPLGGAAAGLRILRSGIAHGAGHAASLAMAHLRPHPAAAAAALLIGSGVRCAVDASDGLAPDLGRICAASGTGAVVRPWDLPAEPGLRETFPDEWMGMALSGGEGYQIIFTAPPELFSRLSEADSDVVAVGEVVEEPKGVWVATRDGTMLRPPGGFEHFGR